MTKPEKIITMLTKTDTYTINQYRMEHKRTPTDGQLLWVTCSGRYIGRIHKGVFKPEAVIRTVKHRDFLYRIHSDDVQAQIDQIEGFKHALDAAIADWLGKQSK